MEDLNVIIDSTQDFLAFTDGVHVASLLCYIK